MQTGNMNMNQQPMGAPMQQMPARRSSMPWVILVIVVIVLAILGYIFRDKLMNKPAASLSGYQAVFLTNGQVYFGKLDGTSSQYVTLKDIYYLQVNQPLQSGTAAQQQNQQPQLSLVKLGNELHGPVDLMHINRDQILFFEDLKADGKVAQAIHDYQANGPTPAATTPPATQAPATTAPATK